MSPVVELMEKVPRPLPPLIAYETPVSESVAFTVVKRVPVVMLSGTLIPNAP